MEIIKEESDKQVTNTAKFVRTCDQLLARYEITLFSFLRGDIWGCDDQGLDEEERQVREKKREMWLREQFAEAPCERLELGKREEYVHDEIPRAMASRIIDAFALQKKNFVKNNKVLSFNQEVRKLEMKIEEMQAQKEVLEKRVEVEVMKTKNVKRVEEESLNATGQIEGLKAEKGTLEAQLKKAIADRDQLYRPGG